MIRLRCTQGTLSGQSIVLPQECAVLGRGSECDLTVDDQACSRAHVRLTATIDGVRVEDLGSTNGVHVENRPIKSILLAPGDEFRIGLHAFEILEPVENPRSSSKSELHIERTLSFAPIGSESESQAGLVVLPESGGHDNDASRRALELALRVGQAINTSSNVREVHAAVVDTMLEHFRKACRVCLLVRDEDTNELEIVAKASKDRAKDLPVSRVILQHVLTHRVGVLASDAADDLRFEGSSSICLTNIHSMMCAPLVKGKDILGVLYVDSTQVADCFVSHDLELLALVANHVAFAVDNARILHELEHSFYETIRSLGNALEAKDRYTRGHSRRVADYAVGIGQRIGLPADRLEKLRISAELHDIGKIAIDESIICKSGRLTDEEFAKMRQHPQLGIDILRPIRFLRPIFPFILHHHERYDGTGYPSGLRGDAAPLEARILNLADAFDAMTTQRSYNVPKTFDEALEQCRSEAGKSFDARLVAALVALITERQLEAEWSALDEDTRSKASTRTRIDAPEILGVNETA